MFLAAVEAAVAAGVTVNRVSQGSGAMLLAQAELAEMARIGADHGIEVSLFVGPREEWDTGRSAHAADGAALAGQLRGARQLRYAIDDVLRAVEQGIRGFLVADTGLLQLLAETQAAGEIPESVVWKVSAVLAPSNPVSLRQLEQLGASTVNVPSDVTLGQLAEMRAATPVPVDLYVEAPDALGGVVRGHESADLIAVAEQAAEPPVGDFCPVFQATQVRCRRDADTGGEEVEFHLRGQVRPERPRSRWTASCR